MKLIFLYGAPASGKLTVAEKLSDLTGIPLFHNHLSRDLVKDIYGKDLNKHYELVDQIRLEVFGYCASNDTDLIFTYVYEGSDDDDSVRQYMKTIEEHGGEVVFVEITAEPEDLIKRVSNKSRKRFKKLTNPEVMERITQNMGNYSIPFVDPLKVNTSRMDPDESAKYIAKNLNLL